MKETMPSKESSGQSSKEENLYELSRERKALRSALVEMVSVESVVKTAKEGIEENKDRLKSSGWSIEKEGGLNKSKERFSSDKEKARLAIKDNVDEKAVEEFMEVSAPVYREIASLSEKLDDIRDFEMRRSLDKKSDPYAKRAQESLLQTARKERKSLEGKLMEMIENNPREFHAFQLVKYKKGMAKEGHIAATSSVEKSRARIGRNMLVGKPMFIHGPTGTGKTSLARLVVEDFSGESAEMVYCNPQTRGSEIWGKTGIRPTKSGAIETVEIFGPLAIAAARGKGIIFDEFTSLPKEQMVFIKGIMNAKPGDTINIPGNGRVKIEYGFCVVCTANLKSEKNPERQDLPPEIAREFEQNNIKIDYLPKEEAYDVMLARMMNIDGSIDASWMTMNETLPKLCEAMEEIQIAYTGVVRSEIARLTGSMDASGKAPGLKKFVMTQGTIEAILEDWKVGKGHGDDTSFTEHIDKRLKIGLTFEEYPLSDRVLAAKILASKGFLRTLTPEELGLPNDVFSFSAAKKLRGEGEEQKRLMNEMIGKSKDEKHLSLKELADLDPFGVRKSKALELAEQMAGQIPPGAGAEGTNILLAPEKIKEEYDAFLKDIFKAWNYSADKIAVEQVPMVVDPRGQNYETLKGDIDANKFGEYTVNPEMSGIDWENIPVEKIKILPLTEFVGKPLHEVVKHIMDTYGGTHHIPGIEFWKWILEDYDKAPVAVKEKYKELKDGNYYFNFGSLIRDFDGRWHVPCAYRRASGWYRGAGWLDDDWGSDCRVVLLEI